MHSRRIRHLYHWRLDKPARERYASVSFIRFRGRFLQLRSRHGKTDLPVTVVAQRSKEQLPAVKTCNRLFSSVECEGLVWLTTITSVATQSLPSLKRNEWCNCQSCHRVGPCNVPNRVNHKTHKSDD